MGWTEDVGLMRGLVEGQVPPGEWQDKLLPSPTLLTHADLTCAQARQDHGHA